MAIFVNTFFFSLFFNEICIFVAHFLGFVWKGRLGLAGPSAIEMSVNGPRKCFLANYSCRSGSGRGSVCVCVWHAPLLGLVSSSSGSGSGSCCSSFCGDGDGLSITIDKEGPSCHNPQPTEHNPLSTDHPPGRLAPLIFSQCAAILKGFPCRSDKMAKIE